VGDPAGWFDEARLGVFVHWSHSSQLGVDVSWPLVGGLHIGGQRSGPVPIDTYHAGADTFCPERGAPARWCAAAKTAGARYLVLTTKHHDGFALWPTRLGDWSIARTAYGGDIVGEYVAAARAEGLRVGFYFSLCDWHHPDYPAVTEDDLPYRWGTRRPSAEQWERYVAFMFGQIEELLTRYGRIDVLWFDGQWERRPEEWRTTELEALIRRLQPDILINDRLPGAGDFATPENFIPPEPPAERFEVCMTMNDSWGFCPTDANYKSGRALVHTLCEVAGRGGNLLLNVSPGPDGALPVEQLDRLTTVGTWLDAHGEAVFGTEAGLAPWQFYGPSTRRGDRVHLFCLARPYESVAVRGVPVRRVAAVTHLATGTPLEHRTRMSVIDELVNSDPPGELTIDVPEDLIDDLCTVIALDITPA
jgi:alpha-L-fucosidase